MRKNKRRNIIAVSGFFIVALATCLLWAYHHQSKQPRPPIMAGEITTVSFMTANCFNDSLSHNEAIEIRNSSDKDAYLWIGREPTGNRPIEELIHGYFDEIPSGTSISFNEIIKMEHICEQEVGYTFIKQLNPEETFILVLPEDRSAQLFYSERIVLTSSESVHQALGHSIPEKYLFREDIILLTPPNKSTQSNVK